jgi:hypothetical protein
MLAEAAEVQSRSFVAHSAEAKAREARSTPLRFYDQLKSLWEYDLALQLNDGDIAKESAFAAASVAFFDFRDIILHSTN